MQRMREKLAGQMRELRSALARSDPYERYREHQLRVHPGHRCLDRGEFYCQDVERRWSRINRCC